MVQIKTSELTGTALDYAVAVCEKANPRVLKVSMGGVVVVHSGNSLMSFQSWSIGGPITEREKIQISPHWNEACATYIGSNLHYYGDTYLQSAMRCYVASKLGDVVEIPDELV